MNNSKHIFGPITRTDLDEISKLQPDGWNDIIPDIKSYVEADFCRPLKLMHDHTINDFTNCYRSWRVGI